VNWYSKSTLNLNMSEEKSLMYLTKFSGKPENWDNWEFAFVAKSVMNKYDEILTGDKTSPSKEEYKKLDQTSEDAVVKKKIANYKANAVAFSHLVSCMDQKGDACEVAMNILKSCMTTELPHGDAKKALDQLRSYYNNKLVATIQALIGKYHSTTMSANQDPAVYIVELESLRAKILEIDKKHEITDYHFILKILNSLPKAYETVVESVEKDLNQEREVTIPMI
jgi:gag-polypeptide of LTR copia-type